MTAKGNVYEVLADIQGKIAVPKGRSNDFGGYKYRKVEDIIAAARAAAPAGTIIRTSDRVEEIGGQIFVIATASITYGGETITAEAAAMHPLQKKGMDASQITGSASSYARKYAMQGLFALDDGEHDPDAKDNRQENGNDPVAAASRAAEDAKAKLMACDRLDHLAAVWKALPYELRSMPEVEAAKDVRKSQLSEQKDAA